MNEKSNPFRNINIPIIYHDEIVNFTLQTDGKYCYSLCKNCIYAMETPFKGAVPIYLKLLKELQKRKLKLHPQNFYCIKKRKKTAYPNCREGEYP